MKASVIFIPASSRTGFIRGPIAHRDSYFIDIMPHEIESVSEENQFKLDVGIANSSGILGVRTRSTIHFFRIVKTTPGKNTGERLNIDLVVKPLDETHVVTVKNAHFVAEPVRNSDLLMSNFTEISKSFAW